MKGLSNILICFIAYDHTKEKRENTMYRKSSHSQSLKNTSHIEVKTGTK